MVTANLHSIKDLTRNREKYKTRTKLYLLLDWASESTSKYVMEEMIQYWIKAANQHCTIMVSLHEIPWPSPSFGWMVMRSINESVTIFVSSYHSLSYLYAVLDVLLLSAYICETPLVDAIIARVGPSLDITENLIIELTLFVALVLFL